MGRSFQSFVWFLIVFFISMSGCSDCIDTEGLTAPDGDDEDVGTIDVTDRDGQNDAGETNPDNNNDNDLIPCSAEQRCGMDCCSTGQLCLSGQCTRPGDDCAHSLQCADDEFCETAMGKCLPESQGQCLYVPDDDSFDPVIEVAWEADPDVPGDVPMPSYNQVMMAPSVVDITGDGIPEIVFSTFQGSNYNGPSVLRAVNGRSFEPVFDLTEAESLVSGASSVAIGDIDGDGRNEIVAIAPNAGGLIAFDDHSTGWEIKWTTEAFNMNWDGAYLADLDGNGSVEVVAANRVYDGATGNHLCTNADVGANPQNSLAADLNGDGNLEIVAAQGAFRFIRESDGTVSCPTKWTHEGPQGFPAVGDFGSFSGGERNFGDFDGSPEVAVVSVNAQETVSLYNGRTGDRIWHVAMPVDDHPHIDASECDSRSGGGPPTIADFNGDGRINVATAGACYYVVYQDNGELLWKEATQDLSSRVTGSSVFDFQGNGRAEVVYADECFLRVYDGAGDGNGSTTELFKVANTTGTTRELPVIVDVDGDFHADIVLIGNDYSGVTNTCASRWGDFTELGGPSRGIRVIRDSENRWVSTRPVWNQHAYSVTNVCDGIDDSLCPGVENRPGAIPSGRIDNWSMDHLNNYRQNVQGEGLFHAPNLTITHIEGRCHSDGMTVDVTVANEGSRGVIEGLDVALFTEIDGEEELLAVLQTTKLLPPGGRETLSFEWEDSPYFLGDGEEAHFRARANDDGTGQRQYRECDETNNERIEVTSCACTRDSDCEALLGHFCNSVGECEPVPL